MTLATWTSFPLLWINPVSVILYAWNICSNHFELQDKPLFIEAVVNYFTNCNSVNNNIF